MSVINELFRKKPEYSATLPNKQPDRYKLPDMPFVAQKMRPQQPQTHKKQEVKQPFGFDIFGVRIQRSQKPVNINIRRKGRGR